MRVAGRMQAEYRRTHRIGHVHGTGIRRQHEVGTLQQGQQLLERVLAGQVDAMRLHVAKYLVGEFALELAGPAAQDDTPAQLMGGVVGHRRVALGTPVAQPMAGSGADQQDALVGGQVLAGEFAGFLGNGDIPTHLLLHQTQRLQEAAHGIQHVFAAARRDPAIGEQAVQVLGTRTVVADAQRRLDQHTEQVRAQRHLHVQQGAELPSGELFAHGAEPFAFGRLVEHDELDAGQVADHLVFEFSDQPGDVRLRPGGLQGANQRNHMGHIANRRGAQDAQRFRCGQGFVRILLAHPVEGSAWIGAGGQRLAECRHIGAGRHTINPPASQGAPRTQVSGLNFTAMRLAGPAAS